MIKEYIEAALSKANYEMIEDEEPFYGEVPDLEGVWASGKTLEECRHNLIQTHKIMLHANGGTGVPACARWH